MGLRDFIPAPIKQYLKRQFLRFRHSFQLYDSAEKLSDDATRFWRDIGSTKPAYGGVYHERGRGPFSRDEDWHAIGKTHFRLFEAFARQAELKRPVEHIMEWGCGGGANAVVFAPEAQRFVGVDVSERVLQECERQMQEHGLHNFVPETVDVNDVESVASRYSQQIDLFLCTYVYEVLPTREHGLRLLSAAHDMLKPGGMALIQIKYETGDVATKSRPFNYIRNFARNTTFRIDEFWQEARTRGFLPVGVYLVPHVPLIEDGYYAYFALMLV